MIVVDLLDDISHFYNFRKTKTLIFISVSAATGLVSLDAPPRLIQFVWSD
jgi:hypothetical protein